MKTGKLVNMDAGKSLRVLMAKNEVSRAKLAEDLGVSVQSISALRGNKLISGKNLAKLAEYFNVTPSEFIREGEGV